MQHANIYSEFNKRTFKHNKIAKVLKEHEHLLRWQPGEKILDVGCGPGDITACVILPWIPQDFRLLLGADVSLPVITHALEHNVSEKVAFEVLDVAGDVTEFLQKKEYFPGFNKIFSFYVLQWLPDLQKGVENLFRLLVPGGQIMVVFPIDRLFQKTFLKIRSKKPWTEYSIEEEPRKIPHYLTDTSEPNKEFEAMLLDTGFEVVKCEIEKFQSKFECVDDIKDDSHFSYRAVLPLQKIHTIEVSHGHTDLIESLDHGIDNIPKELRQKYLEDCYQHLHDMGVVRASDSGVELTQSMLLCVARKP